MPRAPGPVNNEYRDIERSGKSASVICIHCNVHTVAKASSKRKVAHLRKCEAYLQKYGPNLPDLEVHTPAATTRPHPLHDSSLRQTIVVASPYWWPHGARLCPDSTALLIIDMQRDSCSPGGWREHQGFSILHARTIIPPLQSLLRACRASRLQVYHTRHGHRPDLSTLSTRERLRSKNAPLAGIGVGDMGPLGRLSIRGEPGHDIIPELYPFPGEPIIDKPASSAFAYTDFELLLRLRGIKNLIIAGLGTDAAVAGTVRDANDRGYDCLIVEDAVSAVDEEAHSMTLKSLSADGGRSGAVAKCADVIDAIASLGPTQQRPVRASVMAAVDVDDVAMEAPDL